MDVQPPDLRDASPTRVEARSRRPPSREVPLEIDETEPAPEYEPASHTVRSIVDRQLHRRMELFAPLVLALMLLVAATSMVLGGDPVAQRVLLATLAVGALGSASTLYRLRRGAHLEVRHLVLFGAACAFPLNGAFYYWGVLSGVLVLLPLGAFVFPVGRTRKGMFAAAAVLLLHILLSSLTILGVIEDRGLMRLNELSMPARWLSLFFADAIAVAAYFIGRNSEMHAEHALRDLDRAARDVAQRGELLAEARFDLARALRAGRAGRFTGQSLGGYTLGMVLGRGAMGEVYEGTSPSGEPCAVKLLHLHLVSDRNHYARFVREARIASSLQVPNVVRVIEASDENAVLPYLVMERLSGVDLGAHLGQVIKLEPSAVMELLRQIAAGLDAAHAVGIVHRDLKPQNIFRAQVGDHVVWKVLDFGVSKLLDQNATLSQGVVVGTPSYMAPEQARGDAVDGRADFYSLALIVYRALTGRPAFLVRDVHALLAVALTRMPPRPSDVVKAPAEVDDVIALAISKDPSDRFPTAIAFADALEHAFAGRIDPELRRRAQEVLARWPWDDPARAAADLRSSDGAP